jgi:hypothetical protein
MGCFDPSRSHERPVVIARFRHMDRARRQMIASVAMNMLTRLPSVALVLIFLPRMRTGLGIENFGLLFATLALGAAATFVIGGFATVGLRIIGEAHSRDNHADEADGFVSLTLLNLLAGLAMAAAVAAIIWYRDESLSVLLVALLPIVASVLNASLDQTRLAYNEHYIVSGLGLTMQLCVYAAAFTIPAFSHDLILAALVFHGPIILASLISGGLMLAKRPYLVLGLPVHAKAIMANGVVIGIADGALVASLSFVLIWLERVETAEIVAWFATQIRLFQMFLTPILMIVIPLASFVRSSWSGRSMKAQRRIAVASFVLGVASGLGLALALLAGGIFYARYTLGLNPPEPGIAILPLFAMFAVITVYKCYSSIIYLVLDGHALARGTIATLVGAVAVALLASRVASPLIIIDIFFIVAAALLTAAMVHNLRVAMHDPARPA